MFFELLQTFLPESGISNLLNYISVRSFLAFITSFLFCVLFGKRFIALLGQFQMKQSIRELGPESHQKKSGTPTMGGILMILGLLLSAVLWFRLGNPLVVGVLIITLGFGLVGFLDDAMKVKFKNSKGLSGKLRLLLEFLISGIVFFCLVKEGSLSTGLHVPLIKDFVLDLGWMIVPLGAFVTVGAANAINLTDGLDGLLIVPAMVVIGTLMIFAYLSGHAELSKYLMIPYVQGVGELTPLCAAAIAAGMGFLWFNAYPAQVFMGDVGSLGLGGLIGSLAVLTKNELLLPLLGGIFVVEALSVIAQVVSFKTTGKRILKMAPIHHHYELKGLSETKIIVRFWIIAVLLALFSLATLKLR